MILTSMPVHLLAANVDHNNLSNNKSEIINNKTPVTVAKPEEGKTAKDLIKNPDQPDIYTLRTDFKVQRGEKYEVDYQPYIASVGAAATEEEKAKVKKTIKLPDLAGYEKPDDDYLITYDKVKNAGNNGSQEFRYKAKPNQITIKHVFQDLHDFTKYTNPDGSIGERGQLITTQNGNTGSTMEVSPLNENDPRRKGFVPEAESINMQVPENAENFVLEYRYNRAHYDVNFDTKGGTPVPDRNLYYEQIIPTIDDKSIPTKVGCDFLGWMPSITLETTGGKTYPENQIIKDSTGKPILNLAADLKMPASKITFTAVWKDKPKAEYVIQFWTEKTDYDDKDDKLPLRNRYDFVGARRIDDANTGSTPDLTNLDIHGITFPDLNDGRLEKAQDDKKEFERYYFLNEELTKKQNASKDNPEVQKSVLSTGETVYNVYYNRRVYTLYFTSNNFYDEWAYWPIITRDGKVLGKEGSPYKVNARFNQSLDKIWPKDEEVSGLPMNHTSDPSGDDGLIGWMINHNGEDWVQIFRDTPPYRLSAEDFIDAEDVMGTDKDHGNGHADEIPIADGETKKRDKYEISLGASYMETAVVHHVDIIKDDFEGNEQIDYDMTYWKSDTNAVDYPFILPHLQGFTLKEETRPAKWIGKIKRGDVEKTFDELNEQRNAKTPFRSDADKIKYIPKFPWGTKSFNGVNAYNYANYTRNKYKLKLNNDPKTVKNDSEYGEGNILDVPYDLPLNDLKLDTTHKPEKPNWVRNDWSFLGWALDPAGDNLVKDGNETKFHYDQILYAKWGEPDYKWKVTFDPNGGSLRTIDENKLTTERKTVKEGDIGQEKETTYPIKEKSEGDKQVFKVVHKQELVEPKKPTRKGYDFMGWEVIRYKKNQKGDYTDEIDTSYRDTYKVPELYSFGNDVVAPVYLKAIWVPNARVDVKVEHYMLDKDYKLVKKLEDTLEDKRANYLVATTGDKQDDEYILATKDELEAHKDTSDVYSIYKDYNDRVKADNTFFQQFRVEPEKIDDGNGNLIDNPDVKNNVFKFFYRPYRQREYKVNYIDERFKDNPAEGKIIDQELVTNGNRHYDARNYRPIPGWKLVSAPQQQLLFDVNEKTNEFLGINGTGKDEITFYYKDVRVIEIPTPAEGEKIPDPPKGYVRVTFKADKGGSFGKDAQGKDITELNYDVIKGLKSDLLPVPKELAEGETVDKDKHYITPEPGKKFIKWDDRALLNDNTIISDPYTFTAYFDWKEIKINPLVITEAYTDPNGKWTNDFAPTVDKLKGQVKWYKNKVEEDLPAGAEVIFADDIKTTLAEKFKELGKSDKDELVREVKIPAKIKYADNSIQDIEIPVKVYKNVYEALNEKGDKPLFLKEAEGKEAKDGGLKEILKDNTENRYIKVTIKPNKDFKNKDDKVYYVNPNAWVEIPEVETTGDSTFTNWTADNKEVNEEQKENGVFDFNKRHKFTEDTIITPVGAGDVVEQKKGKDKPKVPENYVKVIVKTTDKATTETAFEKTFWVNPTKEVTIPITEPTGKENQKVTIDGLGEKEVSYAFKEWQKVETGETDDSLTKVEPAVKIDLTKNKFTDKVTIIEAAYKKSIQPGKIEEPLKTTKLDTPQGKEITDDILKEKITPQEGKEIASIEVISKPDPSNPGKTEAKVIVKYTDGSTQGTNDKPVVIPVEVHKNIIPEAPGGQRPKDALNNYVKITFKAGTGGTVSGDLVYYVSPEVEVDLTESAGKIKKTPDIGYTANGEKWNNKDKKALKGTFTDSETEFVFEFGKSEDIVEKTPQVTEAPKGYVTVIFKTDGNGKVGGADEKIYYVNPTAGIKLGKAETPDKKTLVVPTTKPNENYVFQGWQEPIDETNPITNDRTHVAIFKSGQVTLTYAKGGDDVTGDVPKTVTVNHGTSVVLAGKGKLAKPNAEFAGWKLDEDETIYQPGDQVKLEKARTATAQWTAAKHKVIFDTQGGSKVDSQQVEHGNTATEPKSPTQAGKVFMGWKEKESDTSYFDFNTPIKENKTLIAIWQKPVQKINDGDTVEEQFIKVTFNEGKHGKLNLEKTEQTSPVTYKVAKGLTFADAVKAGMTVPAIAPAKYYKAKTANDGWDKELKLEGKDAVFTAQYEPIADVIPVDPAVTPDDKLQDDKPEGMVLVTFKVSDDNSFYIPKNDKYYVKKETEVRVPTPVVLEKTTDTVFNGWQDVKVVDEPLDPKDIGKPEVEKFQWVKGSFKQDTVISDESKGELNLVITIPKPGLKRISIEELSDGATGKLEVISGGTRKIYTNTSITRRRKTLNIFKLDQPLESGDVIRYWAENGFRKSTPQSEIIH